MSVETSKDSRQRGGLQGRRNRCSRTGLVQVVAALVMIVGLTACSNTTTPAAPAAPVAENQVTVAGRAFTPQTLTISVGDTVTWVFDDPGMAHNVVADDLSFRSPLMEAGQFTHTFDTAGTFAYHCTPHPDMVATIVVEAV